MKDNRTKKWAEFTPGEYYDAILNRGDDSASIAYYLIDKQLRRRLKTLFDNLGGANFWEFQDTIEDFFLYIHDGSSWANNRPFYMLENIDDKEALFKWIAVTYKNFLLHNLNEEVRRKSADEKFEYVEPDLSDDDKIMCVSTAIAYADQKCVSRSRFVMYRLLLTFLNRSLALSQENIAEALDMQPVAYRVSTKRVKDNMLSYIKCIEKGQKLDLDAEHISMRDTIASNFSSLYSTLVGYYDKAIEQLPMANAINELRYGYAGYCMHENTPPYGLCNSMGACEFFDAFKKFCEVQTALFRLI